MIDAEIRFNLRLSRRIRSGTLVAAMFFCAVLELGSESATLTTYYPAPSGVYKNMITTGATWLARDGGNVGIGTASPTTTLDVNGPVRVGRVPFKPPCAAGILGSLVFDTTNDKPYICANGGVWYPLSL